jgi:hypothetical protein
VPFARACGAAELGIFVARPGAISKQARNRKIDLPEPTENVIIGFGVS